MCDVLNLPRSTYYYFHHKTKSNRAIENASIEKAIIDIYNDSKKRYGAPKIHKSLLNSGISISLKRVQRMMKKLGIRSIVTKKFRPTVNNEKVVERINILKQDFTTTNINQKWAGDITYIHTQRDGWCYLAAVLDLCTKKVIGYSFSNTMDAELVVRSLENAYQNQTPKKGSVIFHLDLGSQYTSIKFTDKLKEYEMIESHSRKGCPYNNACVESFNSILKKERVNLVMYYDYESAKIDLFEFIEAWYNRKRIHSSIGYITPQMKEDSFRVS